jgi:polyhydroxybutyrate depolymerase
MVSSTRMSIDVDGRLRTLQVVEGPRTPGRALVLVLHGSRQDGAAHRRFTGGMYDALAGEHGAVVASLDGYRGNWNDARRESAFPARLAGVDDVAFVRRVITELVASHDIDPRRVHAVGYSNGGQMVLRLLHEAPDLLAGAAIVAATMPAPGSFLAPDPAPAAVPVPILLVHGTDDPIVPYRGGRFPAFTRLVFRVDGVSLSAPETARYLARRNGITTEPVATGLGPTSPEQGTAPEQGTTPEQNPARDRRPTRDRARDRAWIERTDYRQDGHPPVRLLTVHGGGHTVPGPGRAPFLVGRTARSISTADAVAEHLGIAAATHERQLRDERPPRDEREPSDERQPSDERPPRDER